MKMNGCAIRRALRGCVAVSAALLLTASAAAQGRGGFGGGGFSLEEMTRPEFATRDVETMTRVLELDENQRDLIRLFLEDYSETHSALIEEARNALEYVREEARLARESGGAFDWREMVEEMWSRTQQYRERGEALSSEFVANVQSVLLDEQIERWGDFERIHRRQILVPRGLISGERVDLFVIVDEAELSEGDLVAIQPILGEYAIQLDMALQRREADMPNAESAVREAMQSMDTDDLLNAVERQRKLRVHIRDINENFAMQIRQAIADSTEFDVAYRETAYPTVYNETDGRKIFAAALEMASLTDSQRPTVEALAQQYEDRLEQINAKLVNIVRDEEPKAAERMIERMAAAMRGEGWGDRGEDPIREAFEERSDFEASMIDQLHGVLTEEQRIELPRRQQRPQGRRGFGGGGGRGGGGGGFGGRGGG